MEEYPNNLHFETMKCIIYVGLSDTKAKLVAWDHNSDNEYRMSMTFIKGFDLFVVNFKKNVVGIG